MLLSMEDKCLVQSAMLLLLLLLRGLGGAVRYQPASGIDAIVKRVVAAVGINHFLCDTSENERSMAIKVGLQMPNSDRRVIGGSSSSTRPVLYLQETSGVDPLLTPSESLATTDTEPASRYQEAVSHHSRNTRLEEISFPPLAPAATNTQQMSQLDNLVSKTMAARLRPQKKVNVL